MENGENENTFAFDVQNVPKHISEVQSGKHGYFCMGCGKEMIAKKGSVLKHHFAHDAKDVKNVTKCYYSDESYRHKLAKEILQLAKQVKVPALYKYPAEYEYGLKPMKIRDPQLIKAHRVEIELPFFEDENGITKWGRGHDLEGSKEKFLLIKPDVAFFDIDDNPILLIELVATHKVNQEKLLKIKRLGIDTIEIAIPKDHPTIIEEVFQKTSRTQWLYNYEQEKTRYVPTTDGSSQSIPSIDEFQIQLLKSGESYECKSSEINNFIRRFRKLMESEQYRQAQQSIIEEIQRTETNTERSREQLRKLQIESEREIIQQFSSETERLRSETNRIEEQIAELENQERELEERYIRKDGEIRDEEETYRPDCQTEIDGLEFNLRELGSSARTLEERMAEIRAEEERWASYHRSQERNIDRDQEDEIGNIERIKIEIERALEDRDGLGEKYRPIEERVRTEFEEKERELGREFENYRDDSLEAIRSRDCERISRVKRDIKAILEGGELTNVISSQDASIKRLRRAKELLDKKSYKDWV